MVGNRARDEAMTTENAEDLTARLLLDVEDDSIFFDQMNPFSYAAFETGGTLSELLPRRLEAQRTVFCSVTLLRWMFSRLLICFQRFNLERF